MKFETPRIDINVFSGNIVTASAGVVNSTTVNAAKDALTGAPGGQAVDVNNILTFQID